MMSSKRTASLETGDLVEGEVASFSAASPSGSRGLFASLLREWEGVLDRIEARRTAVGKQGPPGERPEPPERPTGPAVEVPDSWAEMDDRERLEWIRERQMAARGARHGR